MAVGKTTAVQYLQKHTDYVHISYEKNEDVIAEIRRRKLDKNQFEDYLEIQKLWLEKEIRRWQETQRYSCSLMDFGAEEIEFYTLNYPRTIGQNWEIERELHEELEAVRKCLPQRILFLDAPDDVLRERKEKDPARSREFFEYHLHHLLPLKRAWFIGRENVDVLNVKDLTREAVGEAVKKWVDKCIQRYG